MLMGRMFTDESMARLATFVAQGLPAVLTLSPHRAFELEGRAWGIWALWWLAMAFMSKSTKRRESPIQRIEHLVPAFLGFMMIFREGFGGAWLAKPILAVGAWGNLVCVAVTVLGLLFAVWARLALGSNWSGTVTIKTNHQLIRRGPYRWINLVMGLWSIGRTRGCSCHGFREGTEQHK